MDKVIEIYGAAVSMYGFWGLMLMASILALFVVQMCYYLGSYYRIPKFRNRPYGLKRKVEGISVVVIVGNNDSWYLENVLPRLTGQKFRGTEVVLVAVGADEDFLDRLAMLKHRYANLVTTHIDQDPRFPISNKMAYNVGIKAASHENIVLTTAEAVPTSAKWLDCMARGFAAGEVVIGYCGIEQRKGGANRIMRCSRLMLSVRYLASAIRGRTYRGIIHNIGLTKEIYFRNRGFDHLNMNLGEDDLFIARIARRENTAIVLNPHATMRQIPWGGLGWWNGYRNFYASTFRFYPDYAKSAREWEAGSRLLFFVTAIVAACVMPFEIQMAVAGIFVLRAALVRMSMWRIRRRLGERRLGWALIFYDLYSPLTDIVSYFYRLVRPAPGVWR